MISIQIEDESQIGTARRAATQEAKNAGLSAEEVDRLAIIVTEAGTNLARHAHNGELLIGIEGSGDTRQVTLAALDGGPGISNVEAAMVDGFTTSKEKPHGIGGGLGSMERLADDFEIYSSPSGTVVIAKVGKQRPARRVYDIAGLIVPKPGFEEGGDTFGVNVGKHSTIVMLMDVLGHGPKAARDAATGADAFRRAGNASLEETEAMVADALAGSRGAAALLVEIPHEAGMVRCMGIGNIKGDILHRDGRRHGIPSQPGIVGASSRRARVTEHDWPEGAVLILATDGLKTSPAIAEPPSLFFRGAEIIAAALYKIRRRGTDDCGVLIARARP
ncbi:ATP-binding protein [Notoacmeibacter ruber]|nr:ATP-binding protein [Notoacmeibacter ruber]